MWKAYGRRNRSKGKSGDTIKSRVGVMLHGKRAVGNGTGNIGFCSKATRPPPAENMTPTHGRDSCLLHANQNTNGNPNGAHVHCIA